MSQTAEISGGVWPAIPILMYHAVEDQIREPKYKHFYVTAREFSRQVHELRSRGYQAISLDHLIRAKVGDRGAPALPAKPVILTFDDGYENLYANVHPLLADFGWPYTVYLVSERIGRTNAWVEPEGFTATRLLDWEQIREMQSYAGAAFEAHTQTHPKLASLLTDGEIRREIAVCKDDLEQKLGTPVRHFCYPYGIYNDAVLDTVRQLGFASATTTNFGRVRRNDDVLRLPRVSIYHVPPFSLTYGPGALNFRWRVETRKDKRPDSQ